MDMPPHLTKGIQQLQLAELRALCLDLGGEFHEYYARLRKLQTMAGAIQIIWHDMDTLDRDTIKSKWES